MAAPYDNERLSFDVKGIRESLADKISDVSPHETVFLSNCGTGPNPGNTRFDWLVQSLGAASAANKQLEGRNYTTVPVPQPTRMYSNMQISDKALSSSGTTEATNRAGRAGELARGMIRAGLELKMDMNTTLVGTNQGTLVGDASTPRQTATILSFIKTNTSIGAGGANPTYTVEPTGTRTDGTQRAYTETILKEVLQKKWVSCGGAAGTGATVVYHGPVNIQKASGFTGLGTGQHDVKDKTIYGVADVYKGQFETVMFIPERHMRERDVLVISHAFTKIRKLRDFTPIDLAKVGDYEGKALVVEYGLQVDNELALGGAFDLTTT